MPEWTNGTSPQGNFQLQAMVRQDGTFVYQYGNNSSVSAAQIGWQADPSANDFDVPAIAPVPPQNAAFEFYVAGPASVTATGGTPQSATVNTAFAAPLQVTVTDLVGNPVAGVTVNYSVPGSGASATLSSGSAVTNAGGIASVTATANATVGSYSVTASVAGCGDAGHVQPDQYRGRTVDDDGECRHDAAVGDDQYGVRERVGGDRAGRGQQSGGGCERDVHRSGQRGIGSVQQQHGDDHGGDECVGCRRRRRSPRTRRPAVPTR